MAAARVIVDSDGTKQFGERRYKIDVYQTLLQYLSPILLLVAMCRCSSEAIGEKEKLLVTLKAVILYCDLLFMCQMAQFRSRSSRSSRSSSMLTS